MVIFCCLVIQTMFTHGSLLKENFEASAESILQEARVNSLVGYSWRGSGADNDISFDLTLVRSLLLKRLGWYLFHTFDHGNIPNQASICQCDTSYQNPKCEGTRLPEATLCNAARQNMNYIRAKLVLLLSKFHQHLTVLIPTPISYTKSFHSSTSYPFLSLNHGFQ